MPITAISTMKAAKETTTLKIETSEVLSLEPMCGRPPIRLNRGTNSVPVGRWVFKLVSNNSVAVAPETPDSGVVVLTKESSQAVTKDPTGVKTADKDRGWPDPSLLNVSTEQADDVTALFSNSLSATLK